MSDTIKAPGPGVPAHESAPPQIDEEALQRDVAAAQAVAEEIENPEEAEPRTLTGALGRWVTVVALSLVAFQMWTAWQGSYPNLVQRALHLGFVFTLVFVMYPPLHRMRQRNRVRPIDWLLVVCSIVSMGYVVINYDRIVEDPTSSTLWDILFGAIATVLVLDATRRTVGFVFPLVSLAFVAYAYVGPLFPGAWGHPGFSTETVIQTLYMTTNGILGTITGISATVVATFIIFGAVLFYTGGGETYVDIALYLVGRSHGGLGKVSCISSALFGTISGSAVANVVVDGVFNIPLMKRSGYAPDLAAAVESTASTGGQIVPPIMGAGAFIMAELLNIPYLQIAASAAIPALLYYTGVFMTVHYEGLKGRMQRAPEERIPKFRQLWQWHRLGPLFVPIGVLMIMLMQGYDPTTSVFYTLVTSIIIFAFRVPSGWLSAIPAVVVIGAFFFPTELWGVPQLDPNMAGGAMLLAALVVYVVGRGTVADLRHNGVELSHALDNGGRGIVAIAPLIANANMVVAMVGLTGLGVKMSDIILSFAAGNYLLTLVFAAIVTLILGMGVPTTAAYVLAASVVGPALIKLGIMPLAAHMFIFYFAIISAITPPVCAAVYVAAALARAPWLSSAFHACRLGVAAFIAPFMFVYVPALLLFDYPQVVIWRTVVSLLGITALAVSSAGFLTRRLNAVERIVFFAAAVALIYPAIVGDVIGFGLLAAGYVWQKVVRPAPKAVVLKAA
ncbi:MAG: TRAP transporter fused permease subunit [Chloroflexi bacterium]|nr:TRAP transporter fused permease subunit [Chloroflexota bacterium]